MGFEFVKREAAKDAKVFYASRRSEQLCVLRAFAVISVILSLLLIPTSCAPAIQPAVVSTSTPPATSTSEPTSDPFTATPEPTQTLIASSPTATQIPCDPFTADFCIKDGHFVFQNPIASSDNTFVDVTYRYGSTQNGTRDPHHGVEFLNRFGTQVHAAEDGVVQFAGPDKEAMYSPWKNFYGNVIVIRHADDLYTLYAHLSKIEVGVGDEVKAGDVIGEVGQSGAATGSHLHFEVRRGGDGTDYFSTQNPELWLTPNRDEQGEAFGAIAVSILDTKSKFQFSEFTLHYHLDKNSPSIRPYYVVTYAKDMMLGEENAALGDLPAGYYRIALTYNGQVYERWVEVKSGKLTEVMIVVD